MLEVCVDSLESALNAICGGADELELCSALMDGGLTPSPGLVKEVLRVVDELLVQQRPKVNVMLRCRGGDDFVYNDREIITMLSDIEVFKDMGVDRFVFGALTPTHQIDEVKSMRILEKAHPKPVTFHRAFDLCSDPKSIETIINLGFDRLLTSGQSPVADDKDAIFLIKSLIHTYGDRIDIMPGSGINPDNVKTFIDLGCKIVHSSCKVPVNIFPEPRFNLGNPNNNKIYVTNAAKVSKMKELLKIRDK